MERECAVTSFLHDNFKDERISVFKNEEEGIVINVMNDKSFGKYLIESKVIEIQDFCKIKYNGTRLNFDNLDKKFGMDKLEIDEQKVVMKSFDKFTAHSCWNGIEIDTGFNYKSYNGKWFGDAKFYDKKIDKFRCSSVMRCFGYREDETFYVLALERDHKKSDIG